LWQREDGLHFSRFGIKEEQSGCSVMVDHPREDDDQYYRKISVGDKPDVAEAICTDAQHSHFVSCYQCHSEPLSPMQ
jgi:hypothetical protein